MDKKLEEKMDKILDKLLDNLDGKLDKMNDFESKCKEATTKVCKIHIDNDEKGMRLAVEGNRLSLLIALASAEKQLLNELNASSKDLEFIKTIVSSEKVDINE